MTKTKLLFVAAIFSVMGNAAMAQTTQTFVLDTSKLDPNDDYTPSECGYVFNLDLSKSLSKQVLDVIFPVDRKIRKLPSEPAFTTDNGKTTVEMDLFLVEQVWGYDDGHLDISMDWVTIEFKKSTANGQIQEFKVQRQPLTQILSATRVLDGACNDVVYIPLVK